MKYSMFKIFIIAIFLFLTSLLIARVDGSLVEVSKELLSKALRGENIEGYELKYEEEYNVPYLVNKKPILTDKYFESVEPGLDQYGNYIIILLEFNNEGAQILAKVTEDNIDKRMAVIIDGKLIMTPVITEKIENGVMQLAEFTNMSDVHFIADRLNSVHESLPVNIEILNIEEIKPKR